VKVYIGAPASSTAAGTGYVSPSTLASILQTTQKDFPSFGGVMMWDASQAYANGRYDLAAKSALTASGSCGTFTFPACSAPAWSSSSTYTAGQTVSYNGYIWSAKWWTNTAPAANASGDWSASKYKVKTIHTVCSMAHKHHPLQLVRAKDLEAPLFPLALARLLLPPRTLPAPALLQRPLPPRQAQALLPLPLLLPQLRPVVAAAAVAWLLGAAALLMLAVARLLTMGLCGKPVGGLKMRFLPPPAMSGSPKVLALLPSVDVNSMLAASFSQSSIGYAVFDMRKRGSFLFTPLSSKCLAGLRKS
jgi:hypothetical protein